VLTIYIRYYNIFRLAHSVMFLSDVTLIQSFLLFFIEYFLLNTDD